MNQENQPQYATIKQPFDVDPPTVYCPICGNATISMKNEQGEVTPCPHLSFIYVGEVDDIIYKSENFQKKFNSIDTANLTISNLKDYLTKAGFNNKMLAIEITYGGMAGGPIWFSDVFGFNYETLKGK